MRSKSSMEIRRCGRERASRGPGCVIAVLLVCAPLILLGAQAQKTRKPLGKAEVIELLQNGVSPSRIEDLAREYGISFELTTESESQLRRAGATEGLLKALGQIATPSSSAPPAGSESSGRSKAEKSVTEIVSACAPAVVYIVTRGADGGQLAQGSGFVVDPSGVIVTNFHVIRGAHAVEIKFQSGEVFDSVGAIDFNVRRDIALIKIKAAKLPALKLADSDKVKQGEHVVAIGNPLGLEHTVADGLMSASRMLEGTRYMQISVPISPGSSGGPLFDMTGEVIGITTAGLVGEGAQNLNLAVPSNYVEGMLGQEAKITFPELARKYPVEQHEEPRQPAAASSQTIGQEFLVLHDHGDSFESYCLGVLKLSEEGISFKGNKSPHSFEIPHDAIREVKKNDVYGAELGAFHIKLTTKSNYNLLVVNEEGEPVSPDALLFAFQKTLMKAKQR